MKRKFEGKELTFATKGLDNKKQEKEWIEYQLEYYKLMLSKGLELNYKKNVRDFIAQKNEFENELDMIEGTISILQDQIRNGVDVIKDKKPIIEEEVKQTIQRVEQTEVKGGDN